MGFYPNLSLIPSVLVSRALRATVNLFVSWCSIPCHVVWLSLWACRKHPLLSSESSCLGLLLELPRAWPPASGAAGWGLPAVVAQLSAALLYCFKGCACSMFSKCFAWLSWVQAWFELSPKQLFRYSSGVYFLMGSPTSPDFLWRGFDTCEVILHHDLVVDSLLLMLFCSLGFPGGTDKCTSNDCFFFSLIGKEKHSMFLLWTGLPSSTLFRISCSVVVVWMWFSSGRKIDVKTRTASLQDCIWFLHVLKSC